jgi:hypothetical protein
LYRPKNPFEVADFSGGITDNVIAGAIQQYAEGDNLLINNNKKLFMRPGSEIEDLVNFLIPAGQQRIGAFINHREDILFRQSARNIYFISGGTYNTLNGPTGNPSLGIGTTTNFISKAFWNNHTYVVSDSFCSPIKIFKDTTYKVRNAGLPTLASAPTVTAGIAGARNYIYAFIYSYTYMVEGVTFKDFGPVTFVELNNCGDPSINPNPITAIPVLANGTTENWDTANVKVEIYRTENNQTALNFIGQVTNGTTTFNDNIADSTAATGIPLYTEGDVVENDPPPPAKFIHIVGNRAYYGYVKENGEIFPNRIRQSITNDPDSAPVDFIDDVEDELMGLSSVQGTLIALCKKSIYRVDGFYDELGRGGMQHLKISDTMGCVSNDSIVQTTNGFFFAGTEGFCYCDGYRVIKISDNFNARYRTLITSTSSNGRRINGTYDKAEERVYWACQRDSGSLDNDSFFTLDLRWGIKPDAAFTTSSNGTSFAPTALEFFKGDLYRADKRGYVFRHLDSLFVDPRVDIFADPDEWGNKTIIYNYLSTAFNFGTSYIRKWVSWMILTLANRTNVSVQINSINDDGRSTKPLVEIRYRGNLVWGDPDVYWGDPEIIWNYDGLIENKRHFPAKGLRCNYKQIQITNSFTNVIGSDTIGNTSINAVAKTATLVNASFSDWPTNSVDYELTLSNDNYNHKFPVIARTDDVLTLLDPNDLLINGTYQWLLKGYKKGEAIEILSYVVEYTWMTKTQQAFHGETGANST